MATGSLTLKKNDRNMIGISIGGGAPYCPVLYVVQVFDKTPAAEGGLLLPGDEIVGVNDKSVRGMTRSQLAKAIQAIKGPVTMNFNRLPEEKGRPIDIAWKTVKHKLIENMSSKTADSLGLSRAILVNDKLVKKLQDFEQCSTMYMTLISKLQLYMKAFRSVSYVQKVMGDVLAEVGVKSTQPDANRALTELGGTHRGLAEFGQTATTNMLTVVKDLGTFLAKAVPDTKLTLKKYADAKFEYLSFCLKIKEMDDEEHAYLYSGEPLPRVWSGNYHCRQILRGRHHARKRFAAARSAVTAKLELLEVKRVQDIAFHLERIVQVLSMYYTSCRNRLEVADVFPIEVDLKRIVLSVPLGEVDDDNVDDDVEDQTASLYQFDDQLVELSEH